MKSKAAVFVGDPFELEHAMSREELVGCIFGNANPRRDIPRILDLYSEDMRNGTNIRGLVTF